MTPHMNVIARLIRYPFKFVWSEYGISTRVIGTSQFSCTYANIGYNVSAKKASSCKAITFLQYLNSSFISLVRLSARLPFGLLMRTFSKKLLKAMTCFYSFAKIWILKYTEIFDELNKSVAVRVPLFLITETYLRPNEPTYTEQTNYFQQCWNTSPSLNHCVQKQTYPKQTINDEKMNAEFSSSSLYRLKPFTLANKSIRFQTARYVIRCSGSSLCSLSGPRFSAEFMGCTTMIGFCLTFVFWILDSIANRIWFAFI